MRNLMIAAMLAASGSAFAADPAIEIGAHAGVIVFDDLDQLNTSWYATPRIGVWFNHNMGVELDVGFTTGAAEATDHGFFAMTPQLQFIGNPIPATRNAPVQPIITAGGGLIYKSVDAAGVRGEDYAHTRIEGMASFGTGLIVPITGPLSFRTDARMIVTGALENELYTTPFLDFTWTAGLGAKFGLAKDTDKDKVPDKTDLCVNDPEDRDDFEDDDGCPDTDNDADGVPDAADGCPIDAEDLDGFEDGDGCPDLDNDGDEILDEADVCPNEAGSLETDGCPDTDGDLVPDKDDRCPEDAGDPAYQGCPDTDGDTLPDPDDECPEEPGAVEAFGCPDGDTDRVPTYRDECPDEPANEGIDPMRSNGCPARVFVTLDSIKITDKVYFASGRATIRSTSFKLLDEIAGVLNTYPSIKKVRVEGHTDSSGDDDSNMALSQARAEAVVTYLTEKGDVDASRLVAKGFGETQPIADNGTRSGRAENRRVAFTIVEQEARKVDSREAEAEQAEQDAMEQEMDQSADKPTE